MATIPVTIKAVHARDNNKFFGAQINAKNLNTGKNLIPERIPPQGGELLLETGATYKIVATPNDKNFQAGQRGEVKIRASTRTVIVLIPLMGEECRLWLEDIKRLIEKGEHQKARREIRLAKKVYVHLTDIPEEIKQILALERELPDGVS